MSIVRKILFTGFALAAQGAAAQWLPQWSTPQPDSIEPAQPIDVQIAPDGTLFAAAAFNRSNQQHAALLRVENDGRMAWMRDTGAVRTTGGIERLASGRIALLGEPWSDGRIFVRVHDEGGGEALWERRSSLGRSLNFGRYDQSLAVETPAGDLLVRIGDQDSGDYVVLRYTAAGEELPVWRWQAGPDAWTGGDIAAPADGGAVVTGRGHGIGGGYLSVRFDADGVALFDDLEAGDSGSALGPAYVEVDAEGGIVLAGTPEDDVMGVPETTVWKLSASGGRLWKTVIGVTDEFRLGHDLLRFRLAANGDALLVIDGDESASIGTYRLVRLHGDDGRILWQRGFWFSVGVGQFPPHALAEAPNGRILLANYVDTEHSQYARLLEFTGEGEPCRRRDDDSLYYFGAAIGSEQGWSVAAVGPDGVVAQRYDATGPCDAPDRIFLDGFDGAGAR